MRHRSVIWVKNKQYRILTLHYPEYSINTIYSESDYGPERAVKAWGLYQAILTLSGNGGREYWYHSLGQKGAESRIATFSRSAEKAGFRKMPGVADRR